jgi:hypothetical protein
MYENTIYSCSSIMVAAEDMVYLLVKTIELSLAILGAITAIPLLGALGIFLWALIGALYDCYYPAKTAPEISDEFYSNYCRH